MLNSEKGSALLILLLTVLVVSFNFVLYTRTTPDFSNKKIQIQSMSHLKNNIIELIANDNAWINTIQHNTEMLCLNHTHTPPQDCTPSVDGYDFTIKDPTDSVFLDHDNSKGFTIGGTPCDNFDPANGHSTCVLSYDLKWKPLCPDVGGCNVPRIQIIGKIIYSPESGVVKEIINYRPFDINIIK